MQVDSLGTVTASRIEYLLDKSRATGIPIFLWGMPGVGKTAAVNAYVKSKNKNNADDPMPFVSLIGSQLEPTDVGGLPVPDHRRRAVVRYIEDKIAEIFEKGKGVIFLDEFNSAPPSVQAAMHKLVLEKEFAGQKLPKGVVVVAAANPTDMATGGWELTLPLVNRFQHYEFVVSHKEWVNNFPSYWGGMYPDDVMQEELDMKEWAKARALVAGFISARPELLLKLPEGHEPKPWPSPRAWDFVSRDIAFARQHGQEPELGDIIGLVGEGPALEFFEWKKSFELPDPDELLDDPSKYKVYPESDKNFAVLNAVVTAALENIDEKKWNAVWKIMAKAADEGITDTAAVAVSRLALAAVENTITFGPQDIPYEVVPKFEKILSNIQNESMVRKR